MVGPDEHTDTFDASIRDGLTFGVSRDLLAGKVSLWFYGKIIYGDVFGLEHTHRFYWCFNGNRPFQPYDYEHYNEST